MRADLHVHSIYSDGAFAPMRLAQMAREAGLSLISITDHDSMEGTEEKRWAAKACGLSYLSGWEISAYAQGKTHVLGYACRCGTAYQAFLRERVESSFARADDMRMKANAFLGTDVSMTEIERFHLKKDTPIHTMHIVRAFAQVTGRETSELYLQLFAPGKTANSSIGRPTPKMAIDVIHACGGIAVLAHPGRMGLPNSVLFETIDEMIRCGLNGIECYYTTHTLRETEMFLALAKEKKLLITGGSDYHAGNAKNKIGSPIFDADERLIEAVSVRGGLL